MKLLKLLSASVLGLLLLGLVGACSSDGYSEGNDLQIGNQNSGSGYSGPDSESDSADIPPADPASAVDSETEEPEETTETGSALAFEVTSLGASAYVMNSSDLENAQNPDLLLKRGTTYSFTINAPGHPFLIKTEAGASRSNLYNQGVTNNGAVNGVITFQVPMDAPDTLYYACEFHGAMAGQISIID